MQDPLWEGNVWPMHLSSDRPYAKHNDATLAVTVRSVAIASLRRAQKPNLLDRVERYGVECTEIADELLVEVNVRHYER